MKLDQYLNISHNFTTPSSLLQWFRNAKLLGKSGCRRPQGRYKIMSFLSNIPLIDMPPHIGYPCPRPGRPGAAEPAKPRQGRKTATVRECLWVPPVTCSDIIYSNHESNPPFIHPHRTCHRHRARSHIWVGRRPGRFL